MVASTNSCNEPCSQEEREDGKGGSHTGVRVGKERQPMHVAGSVVLQTFGRDPQTREDVVVCWSKVARVGEDQDQSEWIPSMLVNSWRRSDAFGGSLGLFLWIPRGGVGLLTTRPSRPKVVIGQL